MKKSIFSVRLLSAAVFAAQLLACGLKTSKEGTVTGGPDEPQWGCLNLCSKTPEPGEGPIATVGSINGIAFTDGALSLVPDNFGIEGVVHYRIFETGLVVYQGSVSYFGSLTALGGGKAFRQTFQGSYQAKPETVSVKTFWNQGRRFNDYKTNFEVGSKQDSSIFVTAVAPSEGATATFEIDGLVNPIALRRAEVRGKVFGIDVTITAVPVNLDEILANQ